MSPASAALQPQQLSLFGEGEAAVPAGASYSSAHPGHPGHPSRFGRGPALVPTGSGSEVSAGRGSEPVPVPASASPPTSLHLPAAASSPAPPAQAVAFQHPRAQHETVLQGVRVGYELRRARRRSIGFIVGPEGLVVSAPRWVGRGEIEGALQEKSGWIVRKLLEQQQRARRLEQSRVQWRDGAAIPFLGETVIVVVDPRETGAVLHTGAQALPGVPRLTLHVGLPHGCAAEQLRELVQGWLQRQARRIFEERCAIYAQRLTVSVRRLSLSSASTRWGSASADGSIRLNWRLVHFALPVIDYVVVHELAHLRVMDHSPRFWDVVGSVVPDYQAQRELLRTEALPPLE